MSSILDALRKSDKNRPDQVASGDNIRFNAHQRKSRSRRNFYGLVLILLSILGGVWAYQPGWLSSVSQFFKQSDSTVQTAPDNTLKKNELANRLTPPKPAVVKNQVAQKQDKKETLVPPRPNQENPKQQTQIETETEKKEIITEQLANDDKVSQQLTEEPIPDNQSNDEIESKVRQPNIEQQEYLLFHQLPYSIRKMLPDIKVNIHIYDPEPENRMAIINGQRFNIGDDFEGLITIKDIIPEGVLVESGTTVFLIPR